MTLFFLGGGGGGGGGGPGLRVYPYVKGQRCLSKHYRTRSPCWFRSNPIRASNAHLSIFSNIGDTKANVRKMMDGGLLAFVVVKLLFSFHCKHLRSCRDGLLT